MSDSLEKRYQDSPFFGGNAPFLESIYEAYLADPDSVEPRWREYFSKFNGANGGEIAHRPIQEEFARRAKSRRTLAVAPGGLTSEAIEKQAAVMRLIEAYRGHGHQKANLDPLGLQAPTEIADLDPAFHGLSQSDFDKVFSTASLAGVDRMVLGDALAMLQETYCRTIGFEYMHVTDAAERNWLESRIESTRAHSKLSKDEKQTILMHLTAAEGMEKYLHTKYVGQKRFSLEGGESLIPLLNDLVQQAGTSDVEEIVVGMAHRGRLNVLINLVGKSPQELFSEFEGKYDDNLADRSGDVKYHMGFSSDIKTPGGNVHLVLAFNPSHLEIANPVVEGSVRSRQERRGDTIGNKVVPVLIHGDAAFSGQGVVMETLQLSQARGFYTGGTVHVVCNNQVGFTISNPRDARSTRYCTDVAKILEAPIFHVNADDPEAVIFVSRLAMDYRIKFNKDVIIDLVCYRRHGHNEADEPSATQPVMYQTIKKHRTTRELYAVQLKQEGVVDDALVKKMSDDYRDKLDKGESVAPAALGMIGNAYTVDWSKYKKTDWDEPIDTCISIKRVKGLAEAITRVPEGFKLHNRVARVVEDRRKMAANELSLDWGFAESIAYASLVTEGYSVRITGQDSGRGTFFHRHAVFHNQNDGATFTPLQHVSEDQALFQVIDSLLSEEAVMGFEYGYSTADPGALVIWEAQFGDFANGAQVVIDQFISSGEAKWGR
ncbi:MAG: 2-oxoglutarate dehydrogenase E1 component, partial [Gammaproteobacteria bacterium]|nr:2-oxoglutarate dehydrogenase E1 component [Gammaproteobacteria bacterium]